MNQVKEEEEVSNAEPSSPPGKSLLGVASTLGDVSRKAAQSVATSAAKLVEHAKQPEYWLGDEVERIQQEYGMINDSACFASQAPPTSYPIHITQGLVYAAAASGVFQNTAVITQVTRALMDNDRSGIQLLLRQLFQLSNRNTLPGLLRRLLYPNATREISQWIDTVPGQVYAGGWNHRLVHGHDLNSFLVLAKQYKITGALEWLNHVWLRDFWTPHGIPYLPFGSQTVFDWLVSHGVKRTTALKLLSINVATVTGLFLAWQATKLAREFVQQQLRERKAEQLWERALQLEEVADYESADLCYDRAISYAPDAPEALIWVALRSLGRARQAEDTTLWGRHQQRCYQLANAVRLKLAPADKAMSFIGGTQISLRGLSVLLMASAWHGAVNDKEEMAEAQPGIFAGAIHDLLLMAESLRAGIQLPLVGTTVTGTRPFSAVLNESLALELLLASPQQIPTPHTPLTIHQRVTETLRTLIDRNIHQSDYAKQLLESFTRRYPLSASSQAVLATQ